MRLALALLLIPALVHAEPQLHGDKLKQYKAALAQGRKLQGKKQYADAIKQFEAGLAIAADDPTLLAELGWTAYLAKDLAKAEAMTKQSLAHQGEPSVRGAALYNLGLIRLDRGDKPGAIASFSESLRARPNGVVRAALAKLDAKAAQRFDPFALTRLAGPFASLDAYCATTSETAKDSFTGDPLECRCNAAEAKDVKVSAPYLAVGLVAHTCKEDNVIGFQDNLLAVKLAGGWYLRELPRTDFVARCDIDERIQSVAVADVAKPAGAEAQIVATESGVCHNWVENQWWENAALVVVAGPLATNAIPIKSQQSFSDSDQDDSHATTPVDYELAVTWADGSATLGGKTKGLDKNEASNLLGKHAIVAP